MKKYGSKKATEFTKRDLSPIYRAAKNGDIHVERWFMNRLYELVDYYGFDDNHTVEDMESDVLKILSDEKNLQKNIDSVTEKWFHSYSKKYQEKFDRNYVK